MSWRGVEGGIEAASKGFDAIMAPNPFCYLDYYQTDDRDNEPLAIGGYIPIEKLYKYEPLEGITKEATPHILGVKVNLWTEYIATPEYLEYMLLPRLLALSEVGWSAIGQKDYDRFVKTVTTTQFPILDKMNYVYAKHLVGISGNEVFENLKK